MMLGCLVFCSEERTGNVRNFLGEQGLNVKETPYLCYDNKVCIEVPWVLDRYL